MLSLDASQATSTRVAGVGLAATFAGTVGGDASTVFVVADAALLAGETLPAASVAVTAYVWVEPLAIPVSSYDDVVPATVASGAPSRTSWYDTIPSLSTDPDHARWMLVPDAATALSVGAVGAVVSGMRPVSTTTSSNAASKVRPVALSPSSTF